MMRKISFTLCVTLALVFYYPLLATSYSITNKGSVPVRVSLHMYELLVCPKALATRIEPGKTVKLDAESYIENWTAGECYANRIKIWKDRSSAVLFDSADLHGLSRLSSKIELFQDSKGAWSVSDN